MKHLSFTDSADFSGDIELPLRRLAKARRPQVRPGGSNSLEMKIWAILFALIILASIALIVVVMTEEPARMHGALRVYPGKPFIASCPFSGRCVSLG
jgi:hypothetical protein